MPESMSPQYYYEIADHQGNIRYIAQDGASYVNTYEYYPFGGTVNSDQKGVGTPFRYNGKELEPDDGLDWYDYAARRYDPALGRFTSIDPLAAKYPDVSPYAYCSDNPIKYTDPDGQWGLQTIDNQNRTISISADVFCVSGHTYYKDDWGIENQDQYTEKDISRMNTYAGKISKVGVVSSGPYKNYKLEVNLNYKLGGSQLDCEKAALEDKVDGAQVGNVMMKGNQYNVKLFKTIENQNGTTSTVGGVTDQQNGKVVMNNSEDTHSNELHEAFHLLGFKHPKGGSNHGIMHYPPLKIDQQDINQLSQPSEYLHTIIIPYSMK